MNRLVNVLNKDGVGNDLFLLISTLLCASKEIAFRVSQGALSGVLGSTLDENIQGETQKKLDVLSNQLLKDMLLSSQHVFALASEEEDDVVLGNDSGQYVVAFDPLDGSSNIDINGQIGTIFTIYPRLAEDTSDIVAHFCQQGRKQVCAGYVLYGPATMLVLSTGQATRAYTLDLTTGEFLLTHDVLQIPRSCSEFSINMAHSRFWLAPIKAYVSDLLLGEEGPLAKRYNMRWSGAMVGDLQRVLFRGGIFLYPEDTRDALKPAKLRLLYEANPMAMLVENAQGLAFSKAHQAILDIQPKELHQRVAVIMGSADEVKSCLAY